MKIKPRSLSSTILKAIKTFPAIVVTGPRQSGKTTLFRSLFSETHSFVSLENPDVRIRAKEDPNAFFNQYKPPIILDEIQYVPERLPYIKTQIDENRKPGQWLLIGSQQFSLMKNVSESLAGRAAVLSLLPFSFSEIIGCGNKVQDASQWIKSLNIEQKAEKEESLSEFLLRGSYPEISSNKEVDRQLWCGSYITTYLERDVRNLAAIGDLSQFERFLRLCASRTGQLLELSEMARDIGISVPTAKKWISILETSYQIFLLYPYYKNIGKRLVKSPKLYFMDTGLASYLLGLHEKETLLNSPQFGNLFETFIITDFLKRFLHFGQMPSLYYLRTRDGLEIDLLIETEGKLHLFEIKSGMTITSKHATSLKKLIQSAEAKIESASILSRSENDFPITKQINNYNWKHLSE